MVRFRPHQAGREDARKGRREREGEGGLIIQCPKRNPKDFPIAAIVFRDTTDNGAMGRANGLTFQGGGSFVRSLACVAASVPPRQQRRRSFDRWPIWGVKKERRDRERDSRDSPNGASGAEEVELGSGAACGWAGTERAGEKEPPQSVPLPSILARLIGETVSLAHEVALPRALRIYGGIVLFCRSCISLQI